MSKLPTVITIEDAAKRLIATVQAVKTELECGRLGGFTIAGEWRTTEEDLVDFMEGHRQRRADSSTSSVQSEGCARESTDDGLDLSLSQAAWQGTEPFDYHWPKRKGHPENIEHYDEAIASCICASDHELHVTVGFTRRFTAGKERRRAVVFLCNGRRMWPVVEFVGADDFEESKHMVSLIKIPRASGTGHTRVRKGQQPPREYAGMPVVPYDSRVTGPYAATGLAVLARGDEYDVMLRHAMIRTVFKGWL